MITNIECEFNINGVCKIASQMGDCNAIITKGACETCIKQDKARAPNLVTASLAVYNAPKDKQNGLRLKYIEYLKPPLGNGVGTELHNILEKLGWKIEPNCMCLGTIFEMNSRGVDWCRNNSTVIVRAMVSEWQKRNKLASYIIPNWLLGRKAKDLIEQAIEQYAKTNT